MPSLDGVAVVFLDIATTTGVAVMRGPEIFYGVMDLSPIKGASHRIGCVAEAEASIPGVPFLKMEIGLESIWVRYKGIQCLAYEEIHGRHASQAAALKYGGFRGVALSWAANRAVPCLPYGVAAIKLHAGCKGNCPKSDMIVAIEARGAPEGLPHDAVDALWGLDLCLQDYGETIWGHEWRSWGTWGIDIGEHLS